MSPCKNCIELDSKASPRARCVPSPACGGGIGRGHATRSRGAAKSFICARLPPPPPSPASGGGSRPSPSLAHSTPREHIASSTSPPAPALARGGGGGTGVALERVPFQRDGVGGLARRDRLWREIVDRDGGGHRVGGGAQLLRLGLVDQSLLPRPLGVARVCPVQAIAQRLRRDRERECALEAREPLVADAVEDVDGQAVAPGRGREQDLGALSREPIGGTAAAQ